MNTNSRTDAVDPEFSYVGNQAAQMFLEHSCVVLTDCMPDSNLNRAFRHAFCDVPGEALESSATTRQEAAEFEFTLRRRVDDRHKAQYFGNTFYPEGTCSKLAQEDAIHIRKDGTRFSAPLMRARTTNALKAD